MISFFYFDVFNTFLQKMCIIEQKRKNYRIASLRFIHQRFEIWEELYDVV